MRSSPVSIWISMLPIASIQSSVWNAMLAQSECPTSLYMVSSKLCTVGKAETTSQWPAERHRPPTGFSRGSAAGSSPLLPA
jgi:hypothetical protein